MRFRMRGVIPLFPHTPSWRGKEQLYLSFTTDLLLSTNSRILFDNKRSLERPKSRWEDNNKMDLREVRYEGMDWIDLAQDRDRWRALVNAVMNLRVSQKMRGIS
jgi:hypothetical protein